MPCTLTRVRSSTQARSPATPLPSLVPPRASAPPSMSPRARCRSPAFMHRIADTRRPRSLPSSRTTTATFGSTRRSPPGGRGSTTLHARHAAKILTTPTANAGVREHDPSSAICRARASPTSMKCARPTAGLAPAALKRGYRRARRRCRDAHLRLDFTRNCQSASLAPPGRVDGQLDRSRRARLAARARCRRSSPLASSADHPPPASQRHCG